MLLTTESEIILSGRNIKYYQGLGYDIPRSKDARGNIRVIQGTIIKVKVEDLSKGSHALVKIKCDGCEKILEDITWQNFLKYRKDDGKYYCSKCSSILFGKEKGLKTKLAKSKSFEHWCIENNRQDVLDRWDYDLNDCKPNGMGYSTNKKYYLKCPKGLHESELTNINSITNMYNLGQCSKCNSLAQYLIDLYGKNALELYWDYEKNNELGVYPYNLQKCSNKKVWIKCQKKDYHGSYETSSSSFTKQESRCPYCANNEKVHPLDSLGKLLEDKGLIHLWSEKNKKSPYEYTTKSKQKVWWKCAEKNHKDYYRIINDSNVCEFRCPECVSERNESFLQEKVRLYLESLKNGEYTILHEHNCTIVPINPKIKKVNNTLPFDNEVKELKLIIEVHGKQHYCVTGFHQKHAKRNNVSPENELYKQRLYDRYKRIYAKSQGYNYLEIPYWTDDKNETWRKLIDNIILNEKIL